MLTAQGILKIYEKMAYTAVNIGPYDTPTGIQTLKNQNSIPWVSCNFFNLSGDSVFAQHITADVASIRVGITGVTSKPEKMENSYLFKEWQDSLPAVLDNLRKSTDFIILLSSLPQNENIAILEKFPDIRLLISANPNRPNLQPKLVNKGIITQTANQGKYLGQIKITHPTSDYFIVSNEEALERLQNQLNILQRNIESLESSKSKQDKELLDNLDLQYKKVLEEIRIRKGMEIPKDKNQLAQYEIRFIPLSEKLPEDEGINKLIDEISNEIKTANIKKNKSFKDKQLFFNKSRKLSGAEVCRQCHPKQYTFWQATSHYQSLDSLKEKNEDTNGNCLPCHITQNPEVFMMDNSDVMLLFREKKEFGMVGCESCHGAGRNHSNNTEIKMAEYVSEKACRICHTPLRDDAFAFQIKRQRIACPSL